MKYKRQCRKFIKENDGFTLIEVIVVAAIIVVLIGISYEFFILTSKHTKNEHKQAYIRSDFRLAQKFLMEDIRYFDGEISVGDNELNLGDISYSIFDNKLIRTVGDSTLVFDEIYDVKFDLENTNLVRVSFNDDTHKFAVAIWSFVAANTPEEDKSNFYYFVIERDVFVYGTDMSVSGSTSVKGEDSTVVITRSKSGYYELKGNNNIYVNNIYIDNTLEFDDNASTRLGEWNNGDFKTETIRISGDLLLKNGGAELRAKTVFVNGKTIYGDKASAKIRAEIVNFKGPVTINNGGAVITAKDVYVDGDLVFNDNASAVISCENLYVKGDLTLKNGGARIDASKKLIVEGSIKYDNSSTINAGSAYIYKDITFNNWSASLNTDNYFVQGDMFPYEGRNITDHIKGTRIYEKANIPSIIEPEPIPYFDISNSLRPQEWYDSKGYIDDTQLIDNIKIYSTDDCSFDPYYNSQLGKYLDKFKNITIISNGDINLGNMSIEAGFLFAPNGKVTFKGASFEGIAITRDGFIATHGGASIKFRTLDECFADPSEYPIQ